MLYSSCIERAADVACLIINIFKDLTKMTDSPLCPKCSSKYVYEDHSMYICPECAHEWTGTETAESASDDTLIVNDANGNPLNDGDHVTIAKDLKVKGSSSILKVGTKVKIIRIIDEDHNIDCRIDGIGSMMLKSEFVKKAKKK